MMDAKNLTDLNSPSGSTMEEPNPTVVLNKSITSCCPSLLYKESPQAFVSGRESLFSQALLCSVDIGKESIPFDHNINVSQSFMDSPFNVRHVNADRHSISFKALSTSFNIGRESMPFNISTLDPDDIGRPSLLVNKTLDLGGESLGLLNISACRESLGILDQLPDLNSGLTTDLNTPAIFLSDFGKDTNNTVNSLPSSMNNALLLPHSTKESVSSVSSMSSFGSFKPSINPHGNGSSEISRIYSVGSSSKSDSKTDLLNNAFRSSQEFLKRLRLSQGSSHKISTCSAADFDPVPAAIQNSPVLSDFRRRMLSVPASNDLNDRCQTPRKSESSCGAIKKDMFKFWSAEKIRKSAPLKRRSFCGQESFSAGDDDDNFNDSVFIEANHIAHKMANSFVGDAGVDDDLLDATAPPDWDNIDEPDRTEEKPPPKYDKDAVMKIVAKYLPPFPDRKTDLKSNLKLKSQHNASTGNISNISNISVNKDIVNVSHTSENSNKNVSGEHSKRSNLSKSKDARDLLYNLSEILNNTNKSEHQKSEGQSLLNTLASILTHSPEKDSTASLEDSGHSLSAENDVNGPGVDKHDGYEALDLRTSRSRSESDLASNLTKSDGLGARLTMSSKRKTESSYDDHMSRSCNFLSTKNIRHGVQSLRSGLESERNNSDSSVNRLTSSVSSSRLSTTSRISFNRFKVKRPSESVAIPKRGPLRALPIESLAPHKSQDPPAIAKPPSNGAPTCITTPEKCQELGPNLQNEKNSTPITHKSKMKPMAQSTPDKPKWSYKHRSSGIVKPSSSGKAKTTPSTTGSSVNSNSGVKRFSTGSVADRKPTVSSTSNPSRDSRAGSIGGRRMGSLSGLKRSYSVTETKKGVEAPADGQQKRSQSISRESGLMSAVSRVRENIAKSKLLAGGTPRAVEPLSSATNKNTRQSKPTNLKPTKKVGKENKA